MKKSNKWTILALSVLSSACFTLAACNAGSSSTGGGVSSSSANSSSESSSSVVPKEIKLMDFEDGVVEVEIGETFSLRDYMKVYDEDGVLYNVGIVLTDSQGNAVDHLAYQFTIADKTGYTLVLTARDPIDGEGIKERTLQLTTVDKSAPYIGVGIMPDYGVTGELTEIPVSFTDQSTEICSNVLVQKIKYNAATKEYDEGMYEDINVDYDHGDEKATFTAATPGRYKITVESWDGAKEDKAEAQSNKVYRARSWYYQVKGTVSAGEIEGFDTPETTVASYNGDVNAAEEDLVYQTDNQGRIITFIDTNNDGSPDTATPLTEELKAQGYKPQILYKEMPNKTAVWHEEWKDHYGVVETKGVPVVSGEGETATTTYSYFFKSTYRTTSFYRYGVDAEGKEDKNISWVDDTRWNYLSVWVYVDGEDGETAEISAKYNIGKKTVNCNEWVEMKFTKTEISNFGGNPFNIFSPSTHTKVELLTCAENRTIYVDKISYEWSEEFYVAPFVPLADNEVEAFSEERTVACAYGATYDETNEKWIADKTKFNETAQWHETFEGRNGVISLDATFTNAYGAEYHLSSLTRDTNFYRYGVDTDGNTDKNISWKDDTRWDYISVWLYIASDNADEIANGVELSSVYDVGASMVAVNTWIEFKITKDVIETYWGGYHYYILGKSEATYNNRKAALFMVGDGTEAAYTVYVDSISYEKEVVAE